MVFMQSMFSKDNRELESLKFDIFTFGNLKLSETFIKPLHGFGLLPFNETQKVRDIDGKKICYFHIEINALRNN